MLSPRKLTDVQNHAILTVFILVLLVSFPSQVSAQFLVTNKNDSGAGSLRAAIVAANADPNPNAITFDTGVFPAVTPCAAPLVPLPPLPHLFVSRAPNVAVAAPGSIVLTSQLPNITGAGDSINGTGACVVIDGRHLIGTGFRIRASNVTIQGLTIQNFIGNDAVRVEGRDNAAAIAGVLVTGNNFYMVRRAVRVSAGIGTVQRTVDASVIGNTIQDAQNGIFVDGNFTGDGGPGNIVSALIDSNFVQATFTPIAGQRGDGINVLGATDTKSNNVVSATISNNTVRDVIDDGITAGGCGRDDTGSNNFVYATITGNTLQHFTSNSPNHPAPAGIFNGGIIIFGAGGESSATSACAGNTIHFLVANNTVNKFPNFGIRITGGDELTTMNHVQGDILGNTIMNSPGNPTTPTVGGNGIQITGGSGTQHMVHNINICGNASSRNFNRGIFILGGSGIGNRVENITVCGGTVRDNGSDGIGILGSGNNGLNNTVNNVTVTGNQLSGNDDGIFVLGGPSGTSMNSMASNIDINGNGSSRNRRDGIRVSLGDLSNLVSLSGISNNDASRNGRDGIGISSNVSGTGNTPVSGNNCNANGEDGIDINSDGYGLSNNSCSRNTAGDGINAVGTGIGGNLDNGGNRARRNAACNEPLFCF